MVSKNEQSLILYRHLSALKPYSENSIRKSFNGHDFRQSLQTMHFSGLNLSFQSGSPIVSAWEKQAEAQLPQLIHRLSSYEILLASGLTVTPLSVRKARPCSSNSSSASSSTSNFPDFPASPAFPDLEAAAQRARTQADGTALAPPDAARREAADLEVAALARRMRTQGAALLKAALLHQAGQVFPGKAFRPAALPAMESQRQL